MKWAFLLEYGRGRKWVEPIARSRVWRGVYWYLLAFGVLCWLALFFGSVCFQSSNPG